MLMSQETVVALPSWVGPTVAISLVLIAGSFVMIAMAMGVAAKQAAQQLENLSKAMEAMRGELSPALRAIQVVGDEATDLARVLGTETVELAKASRELRTRVGEKMANLEAIYEVLESEVEETALDVATTLHAFRTRAGWYRWLRRLLGAGRSR
jgi:uncharacterized protein YoxC